MKVIEIFSGAGGLSLGIERAGFQHKLAIDNSIDACKTISLNRNWNILQTDISAYHFASNNSELDLLAGGPPCQPFSSGGKHNAENDSRDRFPDAIRAVRELKPKSFLFENVSGLMRKQWKDYVNYLTLQLNEPEIMAKPSETWLEHSSRLAFELNRKSKNQRLQYQVHVEQVNAADYDVPQIRNRVFFVGFRDDLHARWNLPSTSSSEDSLVSGEYWDEHKTSMIEGSQSELRRAQVLLDQNFLPVKPRWKTVRDAINDLGEPIDHGLRTRTKTTHSFVAGARSYIGHTGSALDWPSKAIKSGVNGIGGGENMLRAENGSVRYFSDLEMLRLQTFPEKYQVAGTRSSAIKQIGNAVPPTLAYVFAESIRLSLQRSCS
jgi:DNA (cytosine-5)-methyltransferase 1